MRISSSDARAKRPFVVALRFAFIFLLALALSGAHSHVALARQQEQAPTKNVFGDVEPLTVLRSAKTVFVRSKSVYFKATELEFELRRRAEFQQLGLLLTKDEANADLIVEVGRKVFTTRFVYTVTDARSQVVLLSGKVSSLGGTAAHKIAGEFVRKVSAVRPLDPSVKVVP